jgi:IS1 family transposase
MRTAQEREQAFRRDLAELLAKHEAELEITDDRKDYGQHNGIAVVTMYTKRDSAGNETDEFTSFQI